MWSYLAGAQSATSSVQKGSKWTPVGLNTCMMCVLGSSLRPQPARIWPLIPPSWPEYKLHTTMCPGPRTWSATKSKFTWFASTKFRGPHETSIPAVRILAHSQGDWDLAHCDHAGTASQKRSSNYSPAWNHNLFGSRWVLEQWPPCPVSQLLSGGDYQEKPVEASRLIRKICQASWWCNSRSSRCSKAVDST